jgi:hypothetical protein
MRHVRIVDAAAQEALEAAAWYDRQRPGLGREFEVAIEAALDLLEEDIVPLAATPGVADKHGAKRLLLKRFPYNVVVVERGDEVVVLAFARHARRPGYWRSCLNT